MPSGWRGGVPASVHGAVYVHSGRRRHRWPASRAAVVAQGRPPAAAAAGTVTAWEECVSGGKCTNNQPTHLPNPCPACAWALLMAWPCAWWCCWPWRPVIWETGTRPAADLTTGRRDLAGWPRPRTGGCWPSSPPALTTAAGSCRVHTGTRVAPLKAPPLAARCAEVIAVLEAAEECGRVATTSAALLPFGRWVAIRFAASAPSLCRSGGALLFWTNAMPKAGNECMGKGEKVLLRSGKLLFYRCLVLRRDTKVSSWFIDCSPAPCGATCFFRKERRARSLHLL